MLVAIYLMKTRLQELKWFGIDEARIRPDVEDDILKIRTKNECRN